MKNLKGIYFFLLIIFFASCGPSKLPDDSLKHVPEDISSVTAFNMNLLLQKADLEYIKSLDFYQDAIKDLKTNEHLIAATLEDPASTGVDLTKNVYLVSDIDKDNPAENFTGLVFSIADASVFETTIAELKFAPIQTGANYQFAQEDNGILAWNENFGLLGMTSRNYADNQIAARFFNDGAAGSIVDNKDLKKCLNKDYDIAMWMNSNALAENRQIKTAASMIGITSEALRDNHVHSYLTFDDGAINGNSKHFFQKELTNDLNLFFKDGIDQDVSKYIPAKDLGLLFGASLDAKGIYQVISEKIGGYALANKALKEYGFTSKDVANAFGGDVVVAIYDTPGKSKMPNGLIVSTINDEKIFNKFIDLGEQFDMLSKVDDNLYSLNNTAGMSQWNNKKAYLYIKDDLFFISAEASVMQTIQDGGFAAADKVPPAIYKTVGENAFGTYMDFNNLGAMMDKMEELSFTNMHMDAGLKSSNMRLEMEDKNMNSLKALFKMANEIYLKDKKRASEDTI